MSQHCYSYYSCYFEVVEFLTSRHYLTSKKKFRKVGGNKNALVRREEKMTSKDNGKNGPLCGSTFFLDINQRKRIQDLESRIALLGGRVDEFLSKNIDYYVTSSTSKVQDSQKQRREPDSTNNYRTRAQKMVQKVSTERLHNKLSPVDRARGLGIRIISQESLVKWLKQVDDITTKRKPNKVFIRVEDKSNMYRPEIKMLSEFPDLNMCADQCPFEYQHSYNLRSHQATVNTCKPVVVKTAKETGGNIEKKGYCELCETCFNSKTLHLSGVEHRSNIETKYHNLDPLIENGSNFDNFMKKERNVQVNSNITTSAITPVNLSVRDCHGIVRKRKRTECLSNRSSVESIDSNTVSIVGKRKFIPMEARKVVAIDKLQQRIRLSARSRNKTLGSNVMEIPTFESNEKDFQRLCTSPKNITQRVTRQTKSVVTRSKDHVKIRRSKRLISEKYGHQNIKVPFLVLSDK